MASAPPAPAVLKNSRRSIVASWCILHDGDNEDDGVSGAAPNPQEYQHGGTEERREEFQKPESQNAKRQKTKKQKNKKTKKQKIAPVLRFSVSPC
jgi:ribosomal protein L2